MSDIEQYIFEPDEEEIKLVLNCIAKGSHHSKAHQRSWFAYGYGKQPKSVYNELVEQGFDLIWTGVKGLFWDRVLSSFVPASNYGLIRVSELNRIELLIEKLGHLGMVGIFSFSSRHERAFLSAICNKRDKDPEDYLKEHDPSFFGFILDGDNNETESGQLAILQYGAECPEELRNMVINFGKLGYLGKKIPG